MPNRAQRRAQARQSKGTAQQRNRSRAGAVDEYALQERSLHLQQSGKDEWKPSSSTDPKSREREVTPDDDLGLRNPNKAPAPKTARGWGRLFSWLFIILSGIAFIVVMFLPNKSLWAIVTVSVIFVLGVLSLFLFGGSPSENPNVDDNGTAV
ncbi:MAG: tripartite tricarboxylate transporter TctB family protein [Bifidobacteriaceae bacterium]|nr:tripartite tricarboxylate transporter TctB family protein [Bifidobacteriaceae bacterium]